MNLSGLFEELSPRFNPLYRARDEALARGEEIVDLISGNVSLHGVRFPEEHLREILLAALSKCRTYRPDPLGQPEAREAIAGYYRRAGLDLSAPRIVLTPGTSVSYFYCFKLVAQEGDEILCPRPSYPLFETIGRLCGARLATYRLRESHRWELDLEDLETQITNRTRAIVLISPHNPTGMVASAEEVRGLAEIATRHGLAIMADEVFSEFLFGEESLPRPAGTAAPLVFTLNGISKMFALPGWKLGWIAVSGDPALTAKVLWQLELISDTFLPVAEPMQAALPDIFRAGERFLASYRAWVAEARRVAMDELARCRTLSFVPPAGGFYVTAQVLSAGAGELDEDELVVNLLRQCRVLVHPGYFYDLQATHLVMTFVHELDKLRESLRRMGAQLERLSGAGARDST